MEFYKEGDKSKALCSHCEKVVSTTFKVRTANIKDGQATLRVPDVLVAACDVCDRTVAVPQQSFAAVAEVKKKAAKVSVEVRLPRHLLDVLNNSITHIGISLTSDLVPQLLRLYLVDLKLNEQTLKRLKSNLKSDLFAGRHKKTNRLTIKVNLEVSEKIKETLAKSRLNKTKLVDSLIVDVKRDLLDRPSPQRIDFVKRALMASG